MKAVVQERYGPAETVLRLGEIDRPEIGEDEVLVRVEASCVHPDVWHVVTGTPWVLRAMGAGLRRPRNPVPGTDVAGVVEAVGSAVDRFGPGHEVFGETHPHLQWVNGGAFAEYVAVPQETLALKPAGVGFEEAATVPTSGTIALLNLRGGARIGPGDNVLVNGAGGGVGSIAVQLAAAEGARVTGVDRADKLEMIRALGAHRVIDYQSEDFTRGEERYDLIVDVASNLSLWAARRALNRGGIHLVIGHDHFGAAKGRVFGSVPRMLGRMALSRFIPQLPTSEGTPAPTKAEAIGVMRKMLANKELTPIVDRVYPLAEVAEAMRYLESGRARGRIVIRP